MASAVCKWAAMEMSPSSARFKERRGVEVGADSIEGFLTIPSVF